MKPGRELDALVARDVMGWEVRGPHSGPWVILRGYPEYPHLTDKTWRPSTDIADAWEVVEKLADGTRTVHVWKPRNYGWGCSIGHSHGEAYTAPHAICLAALRAVGHEV